MAQTPTTTRATGLESNAPVAFFGSSRDRRQLIARTLNALDRVEAIRNATLATFTVTAGEVCALSHEARAKGHLALGDALLELSVTLLGDSQQREVKHYVSRVGELLLDIYLAGTHSGRHGRDDVTAPRC